MRTYSIAGGTLRQEYSRPWWLVSTSSQFWLVQGQDGPQQLWIHVHYVGWENDTDLLLPHLHDCLGFLVVTNASPRQTSGITTCSLMTRHHTRRLIAGNWISAAFQRIGLLQVPHASVSWLPTQPCFLQFELSQAPRVYYR